jgi:hypothetical protein
VKFTVVFHSSEGVDLSYGLLFVPCPVWSKGESWVVNLNPESPSYQLGSVKKLLGVEPIIEGLAGSARECLVVVHQVGHGDEAQLHLLQEDLESEGFKVSLCRFQG